MEMALTFNEVTFQPIIQNNQLWVRGYQIGTALGYGENADVSVRKLYTRHADEFTDTMTGVVTLPTEGGQQNVRIFSLRGCHLLAMFARTPVAKKFRNWVLDVLDRLAAEERQSLQKMQQLPASDSPITPGQQCTLQAMVRALVEKGGIYAAIWSRFNNHFRLGSYKQLPQSRMSEAVDYLMRFEVASKALPAPSVAAVPNPPASIPADMAPGRKDALRKIQSIMNAIMAAREVVNMFCYPEPATMDRPKEVRLTYNARHDFHAAALDCLKAAYAALEAGYLLERGKSRMQGGGR